MKLSQLSSSRRLSEAYDLYESLILENQLEYLTNKYPEVSADLIQQAIDLDRKNAEKLVFGLKNNVITDIGPDSIAAVADLNPFAKAAKSEAELQYEQAIKSAKQISPKYWQWILRIRKADPSANFEAGIFDYLEAEGLNTEDIKDKTLEEVSQLSQTWHEQQFQNQSTNGVYTLTPEKDAVLVVGSYTWVPVDTKDALIEGSKMQNCIGNYCKPSDTNKLFSLRNKFNNPHVSVQVQKRGNGWELEQIKGKNNQIPVDKYIPYVMQFCNYLFKKEVFIGGNSDFWELPSPDLHLYLKYYLGDISNKTSLFDKIPDETFNELVVQQIKRGVPLETISDVLISKLDAQNIILLCSSKSAATNKKTIIKRAIVLGKLDEEQIKSLLTQNNMSRSVAMIIKARFYPDQFLEELQKIDINDLLLAQDNYTEAIEAYPGVSEPLGKLAIDASLIDGGRRSDSLLVCQLLPKATNKQLFDIITGVAFGENSQQILYNRSYNNSITSSKLSILACNILITRAVDADNKAAILQILSNSPSDFMASNLSYKFGITFAGHSEYDIITTFDFDELQTLYESCKHITHLSSLIIKYESDIAKLSTGLPSPSGTSVDVKEAMEFILNTDDVDQLMDLRRTTKSRGVKIMVDRKIAKINRKKQNAGA